MDSKKWYIFDVGTSLKLSQPFYESGTWWFDCDYAHVKCSSVSYKEVQVDMLVNWQDKLYGRAKGFMHNYVGVFWFGGKQIKEHGLKYHWNQINNVTFSVGLR